MQRTTFFRLSHRVALSIGLAALFGLVVASSLLAADKPDEWPQWQGPNRDNISPDTGLLAKWPEAGPPLVWKGKGLGRGFSTVAIAGGRIYTMGDIDGTSCIIALDMDGKNLWTGKIGPATEGNYPGTRSCPTVDGDRVYGLTVAGELACLDAANGNVVWHKNMITDFGGKMMSQWGYSESVLVDGDNVVCMPGGKQGTIIALNKKTGDVVWRTGSLTDKASYSSLVIATIAGQRQYVQLTEAHVFGLKPEDGTVLWVIDRPVKAAAVIPTPIVHGDDVWVTSGYGNGNQLYHISAEGGKLSAKQVYAAHDLSDKHGSDVLIGDYIYGNTDPGFLKCLKFATGDEVWKTRDPGLSSLTAADGHLYVRGESGTVYLVEATPEAYKVDGHFDQPNRAKELAWAHPVVCGGRLYLRDQDILLCYDVRQK